MTQAISRRSTLVAAAAALLIGSFALAHRASASNVAWGVTVGGPGFAVSAGQPGFRGGCFNCGWNRPWFRPVIAAPIFVPPPVYAPMATPFPVVTPIVVAPRRVFVPAPVFRPRVVVAGGYWRR